MTGPTHLRAPPGHRAAVVLARLRDGWVAWRRGAAASAGLAEIAASLTAEDRRALEGAAAGEGGAQGDHRDALAHLQAAETLDACTQLWSAAPALLHGVASPAALALAEALRIPDAARAKELWLAVEDALAPLAQDAVARACAGVPATRADAPPESAHRFLTRSQDLWQDALSWARRANGAGPARPGTLWVARALAAPALMEVVPTVASRHLVRAVVAGWRTPDQSLRRAACQPPPLLRGTVVRADLRELCVAWPEQRGVEALQDLLSLTLQAAVAAVAPALAQGPLPLVVAHAASLGLAHGPSLRRGLGLAPADADRVRRHVATLCLGEARLAAAAALQPPVNPDAGREVWHRAFQADPWWPQAAALAAPWAPASLRLCPVSRQGGAPWAEWQTAGTLVTALRQSFDEDHPLREVAARALAAAARAEASGTTDPSPARVWAQVGAGEEEAGQQGQALLRWLTEALG